MHLKKITANLLTIACLLVEPIKYLAELKASIGASLTIRKYPLTVTYINPVIYPPLSSFLYFGSML